MEEKLFVQVGHDWVTISMIKRVKRMAIGHEMGLRIELTDGDSVVVQPYLVPQFEAWLEAHTLK